MQLKEEFKHQRAYYARNKEMISKQKLKRYYEHREEILAKSKCDRTLCMACGRLYGTKYLPRHACIPINQLKNELDITRHEKMDE